jgi:predicted secreted Zn-dependent protease
MRYSLPAQQAGRGFLSEARLLFSEWLETILRHRTETNAAAKYSGSHNVIIYSRLF